MLELGMTHTQVVLSFYLLCVVLAVLDLAMLKLYKLMAFVIVVVGVGALFVTLEVQASRHPSRRLVPHEHLAAEATPTADITTAMGDDGTAEKSEQSRRV
jgi:hypothetical protein